MNSVNIVVTSFNRVEATARCIHSVRGKTDGDYILTVVDDASTDGSQEYLLGLKRKGVIDALFLFERNMGVATAVNMGVFAHNAKYSVKLDNDMIIHDEAWLDVLVRSAESRDGIGVAAYNVYKGQADGIAPFCGGSALLITEAARNTVGCFCEDYSKYGEEDSDYGTRIRLAGLKNLYVPPSGMVEHTGAENASYGSPEADKRRTREARRDGIYMFQFNLFLYQNGLRPLKLGRRFEPFATENGKIDFVENERYREVMAALGPIREQCVEKSRRDLERYIAGE